MTASGGIQLLLQDGHGLTLKLILLEQEPLPDFRFCQVCLDCTLERCEILAREPKRHQRGCRYRSWYTRDTSQYLVSRFPSFLQLYRAYPRTNLKHECVKQAADHQMPSPIAYAEHLQYPPGLKISLQDGADRNLKRIPVLYFSFCSDRPSSTWRTRAATRLFCLLSELASLTPFSSVLPCLIPRCPILFLLTTLTSVSCSMTWKMDNMQGIFFTIANYPSVR